MLRPSTLVSIPRFRAGQFGPIAYGGRFKNWREGQKSQSLNTDQGNSDVLSLYYLARKIEASQSLNTDQGNSDGSFVFLPEDHLSQVSIPQYRSGQFGRVRSSLTTVPSLGSSQSLNTDQGNSDSDHARTRSTPTDIDVSIPQYRSGQFGPRRGGSRGYDLSPI